MSDIDDADDEDTNSFKTIFLSSAEPGCGRCSTEGEHLVNRICFPELNAILRTDEGFKNKVQEEYHKKDTILESINLNCISQVPLDCIHLLCPGVMKKNGLYLAKRNQT